MVPRTPQPGDVVGGRYRIDRVLGKGGMGLVLAATHELTGKLVALKWLLPELRHNAGAATRFVREARAAARVRHPNVVDIYDVGQDGDALYLVMQLLEGETLGRFFRRGPIAPDHLVRLLLPAMRGVSAAHRSSVIHRDLKPENIFLCTDPDGGPPVPRVLDFGISKLKDDERESGLTRTGQVLGTPCYMAPEQVHGIRDVDERCDVYALGVILYEALTGGLPFQASTYPALLHEIVYGESVPIRSLRPDAPEELVRVVSRAMARKPTERYPSVDAFIEDLQGFLAPHAQIDRLVKAQRHPLWALGLGALMASLMLLVGGAWLWWVEQNNDQPPLLQRAAGSNIRSHEAAARESTHDPSHEPNLEGRSPDSTNAGSAAPSGTIEVDDF